MHGRLCHNYRARARRLEIYRTKPSIWRPFEFLSAALSTATVKWVWLGALQIGTHDIVFDGMQNEIVWDKFSEQITRSMPLSAVWKLEALQRG